MTTTEARITPADLRDKFRELESVASGSKDVAQSTGRAVAIVAVVGVIAIAYLVGRRRGKKRRTVLEIRRI
jgi:hypothetical protein